MSTSKDAKTEEMIPQKLKHYNNAPHVNIKIEQSTFKSEKNQPWRHKLHPYGSTMRTK